MDNRIERTKKAIFITEEQAHVINHCIYTSWEDMTNEEKIAASKILDNVNRVFPEGGDI